MRKFVKWLGYKARHRRDPYTGEHSKAGQRAYIVVDGKQLPLLLGQWRESEAGWPGS